MAARTCGVGCSRGVSGQDPYALSEQDLDRIWREKVRPRVFGGHQPDPDRPVLVALGGQTGAGKTVGMHHLLDLYTGRDVVPIIGDDLRIDHPSYSQILAAAAPLAPALPIRGCAGAVRPADHSPCLD